MLYCELEVGDILLDEEYDICGEVVAIDGESVSGKLFIDIIYADGRLFKLNPSVEDDLSTYAFRFMIRRLK